jgi:Mn2+/Fe2+ NRAMP family transporter
MTGDTGEVPSTAPKGLWDRIKASPLAHLGPGLITGVADDDPSGIATYSQAGAQFGLNMLWTMPVAYPLMSAVQSMCARIGRVTGQGLAANIRAAFPPSVLRIVVGLLVVANTLNIAADVAAMGEAGELVTGLDRRWMACGFAAVSLLLQVFVPYHRYVQYLKWLTLSLLAYVAVLFTVHVPWGEVARRTVLPQFQLDGAAAAMIVGVFGTTISPYLFFWQASEEVEDLQRGSGGRSLRDDPDSAPAELLRIGWDTWSGMLYSDASAFFIILATAVTLNVAGVRDIETAAQAAQALKPIAGPFAFLLFTLGLLGVGLIGVPVLAGSAAYGVAEAMGWRSGLEKRLWEAPGFYAVIIGSTLAGLAIQFLPVNPMKALFWSAVINGVVAVPLVAVVTVLARKRSVMGPHVASRTLAVLGWLTVAVMAAAAVRMLWPG